MTSNQRTKFTINELCFVQNGYAFKSNEYVSENENTYEVVKMGHIQPGGGLKKMPKTDFVPKTEKLKRWVLEKGDIIMAMTDMKDNVVILGNPALIDRDDYYVLNQRVARIKLKRNDLVDSNFFYFQLKWPEFIANLQSKANSGVQVNLTTEAIKNSIINVPPLPTQKQIGLTLKLFEDKIDLLHQQNKTIKELAELLFENYFLKKRSPGSEEKPLDEIADFLNGIACQKYPPKEGFSTLPVIKIKELNSGITEASDLATSDVPSKYLVHNGDILFSWSGSLELVFWSGGEGVLNQHLFKVTSDHYPEWLYYLWINHYLSSFRDIASDKATTMGHIQRHHLSQAKVLIPNKDDLIKLNEQMGPLFNKLKSNSLQINTLNYLRDLLLPKLMTNDVQIN